MFDIGRIYTVTVLEWGEDSPGPVHYHGLVATEENGPVVKFVSPAMNIKVGDTTENIPEQEYFYNTASLYFVSAKPEV